MMSAVAIIEETSTEIASNGHVCAGCSTPIDANRRWCSEQCRNRHRTRTDREPSAEAAMKTALTAPPERLVGGADESFHDTDTSECWTLADVVDALLEAGAQVVVRVQGLEVVANPT
jgi:hypothetical protein